MATWYGDGLSCITSLPRMDSCSDRAFLRFWFHPFIFVFSFSFVFWCRSPSHGNDGALSPSSASSSREESAHHSLSCAHSSRSSAAAQSSLLASSALDNDDDRAAAASRIASVRLEPPPLPSSSRRYRAQFARLPALRILPCQSLPCQIIGQIGKWTGRVGVGEESDLRSRICGGGHHDGGRHAIPLPAGADEIIIVVLRSE